MRNVQEKPLSITVIAILHFVFGGLGIVFGICGGIGLALGGGRQTYFFHSGGTAPNQVKVEKTQEDLQKALESGPAHEAIQVGELVLDLALSIAMIISGVGLLQLRSWGRLLSMVYAVSSIASKCSTLRMQWYLPFRHSTIS